MIFYTVLSAILPIIVLDVSNAEFIGDSETYITANDIQLFNEEGNL